MDSRFGFGFDAVTVAVAVAIVDDLVVMRFSDLGNIFRERTRVDVDDQARKVRRVRGWK